MATTEEIKETQEEDSVTVEAVTDSESVSSTETGKSEESSKKGGVFSRLKDSVKKEPKKSEPKKAKPSNSAKKSKPDSQKKPKPLSASSRESARKIINLSRNKTEKGVLNMRPMPSRLHTIISLSLCFGMIFVAFLAFQAPIFSTSTVSVTPSQIMESLTMTDLGISSLPDMMLSYYICKFFYLGYVAILGVAVFCSMLVMLIRSSFMHRQTNAIMYGVLVVMLIATLLGFNYINIVNTVNSELEIRTYQFVFFVFGIILMVAKYIVDAVLGKEVIEHELKTVSVSILTSFTQSFLTLASLFFPLYIFPGQMIIGQDGTQLPFRMRGIDILFGREDGLAFLPMSSIYKLLLMAFTIITGVCLVFNMAFYLSNKKMFVHFNRLSHLFSMFAMIIYALMGLNYFIVYLDAKLYNEIFTLTMNTYSYVPVALLIIFWLGCGMTNLALARVNVSYKVYAEPKDEDEEEKEEELKKEEEKKKDAPNTPFAASDDPLRVALEEKEKGDDSVPDPIPAFSELDRKRPQFTAKYQNRLTRSFQDITLPKLVTHVIEYAKYSRERLSYGPVEVKTFLAGIAASRLSILQGMSGTGKTSLPKIFMESIDGTCEIVAVESSWRDKNELLGYYNEFNKKYTPKSFTQFLYKASLNKEVPTFIVLDEMNLSRIEYYFSDFLSLMESREHMRFIKLFDVQLFPKIDERTEYTSLRDGHTIDIPTNVWFIGTANRDESTFEISDKVYDRAQTMNFDKRAAKVTVTEQIDYPQKFVSYTQLRNLFEATKSLNFDAENYDAIKKVELLLKPYKISFGNRVLKQIEEFVKAYIGCSDIKSESDRAAFTHEAVDCIIFSKVVRKLELKQITDIDTLIEGFAALKLPKCLEFIYSLVENT